MSKKTKMIEKKYVKRLRKLKDQNLIKVITGIRRCGKFYSKKYAFVPQCVAQIPVSISSTNQRFTNELFIFTGVRD